MRIVRRMKWATYQPEMQYKNGKPLAAQSKAMRKKQKSRDTEIRMAVDDFQDGKPAEESQLHLVK